MVVYQLPSEPFPAESSIHTVKARRVPSDDIIVQLIRECEKNNECTEHDGRFYELNPRKAHGTFGEYPIHTVKARRVPSDDIIGIS